MNPIVTGALRKWLPISFLLAALAGCDVPQGSASRAEQFGGPAPAAPMRVTPIRPARKTLAPTIDQPGRIEAFEETPLYARVAGYVEKMYVDIGDQVAGPQCDASGKVCQPGQLLVELSVPELAEQVAQKEAGVGQAQSEIEQAQAAIKVAQAAETSASARLDEAEAAVEQTQADYDFAHSEFVRLKKLAERGAVTREIAEEKEKLFRAAESARKQTQARVASAKAAIAERQAEVEKSRTDLAAAHKKLEAAEADLALARALLGYTKIRAPYDGIVTARNVHTGHLVQPGIGSGGKPLLVVAQTRVMRVFVDIPEADAALVATGSEAEIRVPAGTPEAQKPRLGTVARSSWILESGSRTLRAEIDLPNADGQLRPGMYAHVTIKLPPHENALCLPKTATFREEKQAYCYTIGTDGIVAKTPLGLGIRSGDDVEILSGLSGDEQVIGVNLSAFREGQEVEVSR